ncbi:pyridoxal-phosphate-dependent aminotransferase family protein [[Limnothrix rosea] IAM M-220]|uniref:pyridoxal-phosphate-dependent aminotransferase family protein n=1 Tax=[Limnothrix rosea] IAM M-220 TaxID=454133 RepID=UPI000968492B|nr:alanine--glyoxylate aminotransferase family protein [[Limnothrix rosea] IAM M-220]OKH19745.1 alanine--glyoxylate aminotransferase [[Limnothrix rosea] IAM M-220]
MPTVSEKYLKKVDQLDLPPRLLLGPGPSNAHPRVLAALAMPPIGHLDPKYLEIMEEVKDLLRYTWQTSNEFTISASGTGSAAMEATLANTVEPGDVVLIGINGYFGHRLVDMASRYGADVRTFSTDWGKAFTLEEITAAVAEHEPKVLGLVHAETSTGARQPLEGVSEVCQKHGSMLLIDTVTSLSGVPLFLDEWGVDMAYSGTQKALACPPGLGPLTLGPRALEALNNRKTPVKNWYLDMSMISKYWGTGKRVYHHTAPVNMNYALREALMLVVEEGLENRWQRHQDVANLFWEGLADMGLKCYVDKEIRLPTLTTVCIPDGVDGAAVAKQLMADYNIEIAGGLGDLAGKVWRVGLMGHNARAENVMLLLAALKKVLFS